MHRREHKTLELREQAAERMSVDERAHERTSARANERAALSVSIHRVASIDVPIFLP